LDDDGAPRDGRLVFFYDVLGGAWGFHPRDRGSFQVRYLPADVEVDRRPTPERVPQQLRFKEQAVAARPIWTLPDPASATLEAANLPSETLDALGELVEDVDLHRDLDLSTLVGGHPDPVQGDMELECALVTEGVDCGTPKGYRRASDDLKARAPEWRLLFQLPSLTDQGMMWCDVGRLYWWIRADRLRAGAFEDAWGILQSH
ncbi:MAG: YwqG family protein, partial [Planctomycetota bacterium]